MKRIKGHFNAFGEILHILSIQNETPCCIMMQRVHFKCKMHFYSVKSSIPLGHASLRFVRTFGSEI